MEGLFKRAKAFIGLEEGEEYESQGVKQMEITSVLRGGKKESKNGETASDIMVYEPKVYEDSLNISASLRRGNPVIVNLKHLDSTEGTRLIDFVCGTAYAIDGHMMKIGETIFLFTSREVNIIDAEGKLSMEEEINSVEEKREPFFSRR
ncbi:MAG: cell division inhibitor SepF [Candidatus Saganbacteria bacterium]|uniref:Cell division protein SepF n=1 Tax=Candidatus Saganbacteria bacterium TaxID=2575572 RepID=A0A833L0X0_UNCSA|nr:MAG: cell division inhibitor SepF [Candidatus Saganbacteria bacterium]